MNNLKLICKIAFKILCGKSKFFNFSSFVSIFALTIGSASLLVVIFIMNGLQSDIINPILEMSSYHIRIDDKRVVDKNIIDGIKQNVKGIKAIYPSLEFEALIRPRGSGEERFVFIKALPKDFLYLDSNLAKETHLKPFILKEDEILIGSSLAYLVSLGGSLDQIDLFSYSFVKKNAISNVFNIRDYISFSYREYNSIYSIISLEGANKTFGFVPKELAVKVKNIKDVIKIKKDLGVYLKKIFPDFDETKIESYESLNSAIFFALKTEKTIMIIISALVFLVIAVNLSQNFARFVYRKKREIAILKSMGVRNLTLFFSFCFSGFLIGFIGGGLGALLGYFLTSNINLLKDFVVESSFYINNLFQGKFNIYSSFSNFYAIEGKISLNEELLAFLFSIFFCTFASYKSAKSIYSMQVAVVLKEE